MSPFAFKIVFPQKNYNDVTKATTHNVDINVVLAFFCFPYSVFIYYAKDHKFMLC